MSDDVERERARYEALATLVDGYRRERDEAREQLYLTKAELGRWVDRETKAVRERDEARAEVERLRETKDYLRTWLSSEELEGLRVKAAEHPLLWEEIHHLKDEVERLRVELIRAGSRECDIAACNCGTWHHQSPRAAYRRGAEAMREACTDWVENWENDGVRIGAALRDLPIPEDK